MAGKFEIIKDKRGEYRHYKAESGKRLAPMGGRF